MKSALIAAASLSVIFLSCMASASEGISSQIEAYRSTMKTCKNQNQSCKTEYSVSFKNLEASFPGCLNEASAKKEGCLILEKFVAEHVILSNPSYVEIGRALKFINQRAHLNSKQQAGL